MNKGIEVEVWLPTWSMMYESCVRGKLVMRDGTIEFIPNEPDIFADAYEREIEENKPRREKKDGITLSVSCPPNGKPVWFIEE